MSQNIPSEDSKKSVNEILDDIYGPSSSAYYENTLEGKEIANRFQKIFKKTENDEGDFIQNISSLPLKAFIKCEYIKCGKPNCDQEHGPYYYGYWKDPKTKKLRKKYLGKL